VVRRGALSGAVFLVVRCCSAAVDVAVGKFKLFSALFSCLFFIARALYLFWYGIFLLFRRLSGKCLRWLFFCGAFSLTLSFRERDIFGKGKEQSKYNTAIILKKKNWTSFKVHSNMTNNSV